MPRREQKLIRASNILSRYFGLTTIKDLAAQEALQRVGGANMLEAIKSAAVSDPTALTEGQRLGLSSVGGAGQGEVFGVELTEVDQAEKALISLIIDTTEGARTTKQMVDIIRNEILTDPNIEDVDSIKKALGTLAQIHYSGGEGNFALGITESDGEVQHLADEDAEASINSILNNENHKFINSTPGRPSKEAPGLSVILSNSTRISLQQRFVNPVILFLNSVPNVEIQRAVPFVSLEFIVDRPPLSSDGRIQGVSLPKFLLGAKRTSNSNVPEQALASAKPDSQSALNPNELAEKTLGGMELFTSPQTMVQADAKENNAVRANPILDKFRPFMSLTDINISIVPSTGMMSFKTAKVTFVLHDRSRLNEIAEFIRPDLYSRNEISLEYGWSHPDGEREGTDNPYGDLINGLRVREKYMIRNSSFSLDEAGQVVITLDLAMRGGTDFDTEVISSNEQTVGKYIAEIRRLEETISELRSQVFPEGTGAKQREIRGISILNAAQDARNHLTFTEDFKNDLTQFRRTLNKSQNQQNNPDVSELLSALDELYGSNIRLRREGNTNQVRNYTKAQNSATARLRRAMKEEISQKIQSLVEGPDPFLTPLNDIEARPSQGLSGRKTIRNVEDPSGDREQRERLREFKRTQFGIQVDPTPVSLAKLLLHFIGEPLAATQRYDDVQLIFYPFNRAAGAARRINIGNFVVDVAYFADEFARYRLNHLGKNGNMSLRDFMSFLTDIIIDDPAAPSYGLDGIFETVVSENGQILDTRIKLEAPAYQARMEDLLNQYGVQGGNFRMPQIDFYIEALPERTSGEEGDDADSTNQRTILRVHIFDKAATSYESVGSIVQSARDTAITAVGNALNPENSDEGNSSVKKLQAKDFSRVLQLARSLGLVQIVNKDGEENELGPDSVLRFVGRSNETLKQFMMSTIPYIIYGAANTAIRSANLASMQNAQLSTVHMLRSFRRREEIKPNGEQPGGLPMRVIPAQLSLEIYGCPIISYAQQFFIDFQTGTTADNIYFVTGLEHRFRPGEFTSEMRFVPHDAFGQYESLLGRISSAKAELENIQNDSEDQTTES